MAATKKNGTDTKAEEIHSLSRLVTDEPTTTGNPPLPEEVSQFQSEPLSRPYITLTETQWLGALHHVEVKDKLQQIKSRPWLAIGVFMLLFVQNLGIWFIVVWALQKSELSQLQLIFSTLIAGTLTQSYFVLKFVVNKVFSDIDYHNDNKN